MSSRFIRVLAPCVAAALWMTACVVAPPRGRIVVRGVVAAAPPAPRVEVYGAPPYPGYIWIGGFWRWNGSGHVWVPGRWAAPHPGYRWVPRHWVRVRAGWRLAGGRWMPR